MQCEGRYGMRGEETKDDRAISSKYKPWAHRLGDGTRRRNDNSVKVDTPDGTEREN